MFIVVSSLTKISLFFLWLGVLILSISFVATLGHWENRSYQAPLIAFGLAASALTPTAWYLGLLQ